MRDPNAPPSWHWLPANAKAVLRSTSCSRASRAKNAFARKRKRSRTNSTTSLQGTDLGPRKVDAGKSPRPGPKARATSDRRLLLSRQHDGRLLCLHHRVEETSHLSVFFHRQLRCVEDERALESQNPVADCASRRITS